MCGCLREETWEEVSWCFLPLQKIRAVFAKEILDVGLGARDLGDISSSRVATKRSING